MEKFIRCVRERECLWDFRNADYHNRHMVRKIWEEVENICSLEAGSAIKKWKNLKDIFRRELRKQVQAPSGSAAPHLSKWVHFSDLSFLKDVMEPRLMSRILSEAHDPLEEEMPLSENEPQSNNKFSSTTTKYSIRNRTSVLDFLELEKRKLKILENDKKEKDDDYHFLMSFRNVMKKLSDQKKMKFRMKMQEALYDVMFNEDNSC